jgi:WD40 repeat protein
VLFLDGHRRAVRSLAWSPREHLLASAGDDQSVLLWRLAPGNLLHRLQGHSRSVYAVGFSPDGRTLLSAGGDKHVRLWSAADGTMRTTPSLHLRSVNAMAIHPRGVVATGDGAWRSASRAVIRRLTKPAGVGRGASLRGEGPALALAGQEMSCLAFSPDGHALAVGTPWMLFLWTPRRQAAQTLRFGAPRAGSRPPAEATASGGLKLLREGAWFRSASFSPDGAQLAVAASEQVRVLDLAAGRQSFTFHAHRTTVNAVQFSPQGGLLASAGDDGAVRLWNTTDGAERVSFAWNIGPVYSLAFSPDGAALAAGGQGRIVVWDVEEYY